MNALSASVVRLKSTFHFNILFLPVLPVFKTEGKGREKIEKVKRN
jgi:hypothetical protein